jgi:hypothetical protein
MYSIKGIGTIMLLMLGLTTAFSAQESSILLEKAIYTEETLGNLNEAISLYQEIVRTADVDRSAAALALYRLGMCYRKSGREDAALATFADLSSLYPEQKDIILKSMMLAVKPAPWADGEALQMGIRSSGAKDYVGSFTYRAEDIREKGKPVWYLRGAMVGPGNWIYTTTVVDAENQIPISSLVRVSFMEMDNEIKYTQGEVEVLSQQNGTETINRFPMPGMAYEDNQMLHLVRCLPLKEGFRTKIPVFNKSTGSIINYTVTVVALENITVPAGTFECYKTTIVPEDNTRDRIIWFSADDSVYPVKVVEGGTSEQELVSIKIVGKNQPVHFEDSELGIGLDTPSSWYFGNSTMGGLIGFAEPESGSQLMLYGWDYKPEDGTVSEIVDKWIESHMQHYSSYQVRPGTREQVTVGGFTGECFVADTYHVTTGDAVVEYTHSFITNEKRYIFVFQTKKDSFDIMKPEYDSIMSSLTVQ